MKLEKYILLMTLLTVSSSIKPYKIIRNSTEALELAKPYLPENPIVFEAGAYNGNDTIIMSKFWPKGTIHCFEPVPDLYDQLVIKAASAHNIKAYDSAIGDYNGNATLYISQHVNNPTISSGSSSLLKPKDHLV